jgi:holo-[acyl-carrier protein] synthase
MIVGIGVDLLPITRVQRELQRDPEGFCAQLFTPAEMAGLSSRGFPARRCAELFAAKEALFKALGVEQLDAGAYREVEVQGPADAAGFLLHGRLRARAAACGVERIHLSWSSNDDVAAAFVVAESTNGARAPTSGASP